MKMLRLEVIIFFASACILSCTALRDGAPVSVCSHLTPSHSGLPVQATPSPFTVLAVRNGDKIRVRIVSHIGEEFKGFVLQARSNKDREVMIDGKFTTSNGESKTIDCSSGKQNTLTHVNNNLKREVVTHWTPSRGLNADVVFRASVVKTYKFFWTEIDSSPIKIGSGDSAGTSSPRRKESEYHNCFISKGCFGLPSGCINREDCRILLSYSLSTDGILFKMSGSLEPKTYMAMGLSLDASMGDDLVTECIRDDSNVVARTSWNYRDDRGVTNGQNRKLPRDEYSGSFINDVTTCSWTAEILTESHGITWNLKNSTYYLLLAKGSMQNDRLAYHSGERLASQERVHFTAFEAVEGEGVHDTIKIHGTFMVTAWVGFVSFAIILARHFKASWESHLCGVKIWFALHRGFMFTALVFVVIAFIVIFVHKGGWSGEAANTHAILGCVATALGLLQPIMAAFRPSPDSPKRPIFNWLHFTVGNGAQLIAVITIFFAPSLAASGLTESFYWVMGIFVIVHLLFHFLFQLHAWTAGRKKSNEVKMLDMNAGRGNNMSVQNNVSEKAEKSLANSVFRILLLGIYGIFLVIIILALYGLIGVA